MINGNTVLALISARGGSKGIPGKNILPIAGQPLIHWTIEAARASRYIDRLILSSDDQEVIAAARLAGCESPFVRDAALATDEASSIDVVVDALRRVPGYDIVVLLQPTSPLRNAEDIDGAIERLSSTGAPACVSVRATDDHPYWTFLLSNGGKLTHFAVPPTGAPMRRQDLPSAWCLNGAVYVARVDWIVSERSFLSPLTVGYPMPAARSLDIDTLEDVEQLKLALAAARLDLD
jgi:N-acylneuraminate cytidylyltransferase